MKKDKLKVEHRDLLGRKVKNLRRQGILPGNIYGKKVKSTAVQVDRISFQRLYDKVGETSIVNLKVEGEKKERPVLISNVQYHPVTDEPIHVDFHQVSLKEEVEAAIPLRFIGDAPAVVAKTGALLTPVAQIEVKALPTDLPDFIKVDVSKLGELDQEIKVKDLKVDKKVKVLTESELVVAKIGPLVTKEAAELAREEEEAREAAKEEAKPEEEVAEEKVEEKPVEEPKAEEERQEKKEK